MKTIIIMLTCVFLFGCAGHRQVTATPDSDDVITIRKTIDRVGLYADQHRWQDLRQLFADRVRLDYSSMTGKPAEMLHPEKIIDRWKSFLPGFDRTHHYMTNHDIVVDGDQARSTTTVQAVHFIKDHETWNVYGTYEHHLLRSGGQWKIDEMTLMFTFMEGDLDLPKIAMERMNK